MEKAKSIINIISSIIFITAAVLIFSCQERTKIEEKTIVSGDTITTVTKEVSDDSLRPISNTNWREESNRIKKRLDELGSKAKQKGGELGRKVNESVDRLDSERKNFNKDTTMNNFKEKWKTFKEKTNTAIDSLDKKLTRKK